MEPSSTTRISNGAPLGGQQRSNRAIDHLHFVVGRDDDGDSKRRLARGPPPEALPDGQRARQQQAQAAQHEADDEEHLQDAVERPEREECRVDA